MATINLRHAYIHKVSNANEDLMRKELNLFDPSYTHPKIRKIAMTVNKDCFVIINGDRIKVLSSLGLNWEITDTPIHSLVMETQGVSIYAIIAY